MNDEKGKDYDPQRPVYTFPVLFRWGPVVMENLVTEEERRALALAVSYTHLTLPTILLV